MPKIQDSQGFDNHLQQMRQNRLNTINNEADVEAVVVEPLLKFLGYSENAIKRKDSIQKLVISKGSRKENYKPDFVIFYKDKPTIVIDAKSPNIILEDYIYQVAGYALQLNQKFENENPCQITVLINGKYIKIFGWDTETAIYDSPLNQVDYKQLHSILSQQRISNYFDEENKKLQNYSYKKLQLIKPTKDEISRVFFDINNYIWKKEGMKPTDGFWEFVKLFSLKLNNDKIISKKLIANQNVSIDEVFFSSNYVKKQLALFPNQDPIKVVFNSFREDLEKSIASKGKKRFFNKGEELNLSLETIKYVVSRLEGFDLSNIDEDLNGRMFEIFLRAAVRGRELGQYFTPRDVVKFMVKLAQPNEHTKVIDACCGSGGFLIESLAYMANNLPKNISEQKKDELLKKIREDLIIGVDKEEKVSRLARINMYVHKDRSSKIFRLKDALDKNLDIDPTLTEEEQQQYLEAKETLVDNSFQIVLTNPPFASNYTVENNKGKNTENKGDK